MIEIKRKTILNDEDYLRQVSKEVKFNDKNLKRDIRLLDAFCKQTECFALAAIQIGIPKRIVYIKNTSLALDKKYDKKKILINPKIINSKGLTRYWEACLSCLDNTALVERPYEIDLEYYDVNGNKHIENIKGFATTIVCHELDHLDGILHMDKAIELLQMNKDERKEFRKEHPYEIISKD
ncbi:MAG: peptide deformylase [Bacilli bacterium]|nr:peptide deformylase [Bacilli bacterium]